MSESTRLRIDDDEYAAELTRSAPPPVQGCSCLVVETATQTTYPTVAGSYYHCKIVSVTGTETEGSNATYTTATQTIKAFNLGGSIPPSGTKVIAVYVAWRWVFRYP